MTAAQSQQEGVWRGTFGQALRRRRELKGLTRLEVSRMLDVDPATVTKWEQRSDPIRLPALQRLSKAYGGSVQELMAGIVPLDYPLPGGNRWRVVNGKRPAELRNYLRLAIEGVQNDLETIAMLSPDDITSLSRQVRALRELLERDGTVSAPDELAGK